MVLFIWCEFILQLYFKRKLSTFYTEQQTEVQISIFKILSEFLLQNKTQKNKLVTELLSHLWLF